MIQLNLYGHATRFNLAEIAVDERIGRSFAAQIESKFRW